MASKRVSRADSSFTTTPAELPECRLGNRPSASARGVSRVRRPAGWVVAPVSALELQRHAELENRAAWYGTPVVWRPGNVLRSAVA